MNYVFVSGWMREPGRGGIAQFRFDPGSGQLSPVRTLLEDVSFNVMYMDEQRDILYALNEETNLPTLRIGGGGSVYSFHLDRNTGDIKKTEITPLYCSNPCNLSLDADGKYMLVTGHGSKNYVTKMERDAFGKYHPVVLLDDTPVVLLSVNPDGSIGEILDIDKHTGSGPHPKQLTARPHSATRSPSGKLFAVCDKGNDHVYMYRIDKEKNKLVLCDTPTAVPPGTEPRYCVYHPERPFFYHNTESSSKVFAYRYEEDGRLSLLGTYEGLETPHHGKLEQQGLCMHPSGLYLYDTINGLNTIAVFRIDPATGALELIQNQSVDYDWPRGAALSPDGKFLLVACVRGKKVAVYRINDDGTLSPTEFSCDWENAAYVTFWNVQNKE